jgi:hypothetical protein
MQLSHNDLTHSLTILGGGTAPLITSSLHTSPESRNPSNVNGSQVSARREKQQ